MTIGVFGGSFNPPHIAHVLAVVYSLSVSPIDGVLVVPVFRHPFAKDLLPFEERLQLAELAFGWLPQVTVSPIERDLGGESRTLRTLEHIAEAHPNQKLRLILGSDVVPDLDKWHRFDLVEKLAPPLVVPRAGRSAAVGEEAPSFYLPDVSSTVARKLLAEKAYDEVAPMLPRAVLERVKERALYVG